MCSVMHQFHPHGMSEDHARFYIAEILLALEYLHTMDIHVRDVKPANCLTTAAGHILLADFGHSKWLGDNNLQSGNEPTGGEPSHGDDCCVGTQEYMAPETLHQQVEAGKMADYWSVGIILYELMHAHLPWGPRGDTEAEVQDLFFRILTQPVSFPDDEDEYTSSDDELAGDVRLVLVQPRPSDRPRRGVSVAARAFVTGLLEKDPSARVGNDVAAVKAHAFFTQPGAELDWGAALRGELVPPPRELPTVTAGW